MVPGSVGIVAALVVMSRVGETTPYAVILGAHLLLMVSLAATFTPAFTLGLGSLPAHLYSHGSSLLGTAQQVAAAIGTAVAITVLSSRAADLAAEGASPGAAFVGGMQTAFTAAAGIAAARRRLRGAAALAGAYPRGLGLGAGAAGCRSPLTWAGTDVPSSGRAASVLQPNSGR